MRVPPDTLRPLSVDQAGLIVARLATLHATFWGRLPEDARGPLGWLYTPSADATSLLTGPLMNTSMKRLAGGTDIPIEQSRHIADNYRAVAALIDTPPHTVMHGDAHPGNVCCRYADHRGDGRNAGRRHCPERPEARRCRSGRPKTVAVPKNSL